MFKAAISQNVFRKMKYLSLLLPITACLSACSGSPAGTETKSTAAYIIPEKIESGISDALQEETTDDEAGQVSFGLPVNTTAESVEMHWDGERLSRASVCIGDKLYFSQRAGEGRQSCLYETTIGGTSLVPCGVEIPEGMDVHAMTQDDEGDLHLLLRTPHAKDFSGIDFDSAVNRMRWREKRTKPGSNYCSCIFWRRYRAYKTG